MDKSANKTLLCVSFGSSVAEAQRDIEAAEEAIFAAAPGWSKARAFTSPTIRRILAGRGQAVDSLAEALDRLAGAGVRRVAIQPTTMLCGEEYSRMQAETEANAGRFEQLMLGSALLDGTDAVRQLAGILAARCPAQPGVARVWMGHGTEHFANLVYPALQAVFCRMGRPDMIVGTVEGWPGLCEVRVSMREGGYGKAVLAPLMLVAGDHARNDMAGLEPESWQSVLRADGYTVTAELCGLGSVPEVQQMYAERCRTLTAQMDKEWRQ